MREFKKRRGQQGEIVQLGLRALGTLALLVLAALAVHSAWGMYTKLAEASQGQRSAEAELAALTQQEVRVARSVGEIASTRGVEAQVRERFGVARPGEGGIQIVRDTPTSTAQATTKEFWWQRIFHTLFVW